LKISNCCKSLSRSPGDATYSNCRLFRDTRRLGLWELLTDIVISLFTRSTSKYTQNTHKKF